MILSFSKTINKRHSYFMEKIWAGLEGHPYDYFEKNGFPPNGFTTLRRGKDGKHNMKPKIHTIRADKSNRWKQGNDIHFVINNRTKERFQFAPVVKCKSVQPFEITEMLVAPMNYDYLWKDRLWSIYIDLERISVPKMMLLAKNDGFNSLDHMLEYFGGSFKGKIIHWTDFKY